MGPASCSNRKAKVISDCCSSTNPLTEQQRRLLEKRLNEAVDGNKYTVVTAMRYWNPDTDMAIDQLLEAKVDELVLLPLYPQFSYSTTASSFNEWERRIIARDLSGQWPTYRVQGYHLDPLFIDAFNQRIDDSLLQLDEETRKKTHLLFSAHGTPISFKKAGDPYSFQINASMEAIMEARGKDRPYWLSFQSRVGPVEWLKPNTEDFIKVLRGYGIKHLLVVPVAFVNDHIETLHEIGIEFKEIADEVGFETFKVIEGLNDHPTFIDCLASSVQKRLFMTDKEKAEIVS